MVGRLAQLWASWAVQGRPLGFCRFLTHFREFNEEAVPLIELDGAIKGPNANGD